MNSRYKIGAVAVLLLFVAVLALAPAASAQCAMCANAAAAQKAEARRALNIGIATLVAPVLLLAGGFVFLSYKRRNPPDTISGGPGSATQAGSSHKPLMTLPLDSDGDPPRASTWRG